MNLDGGRICRKFCLHGWIVSTFTWWWRRGSVGDFADFEAV